MSSACSFIFMQVNVIFIRMVSHLDSFWNRGTRELENGLLQQQRKHNVWQFLNRPWCIRMHHTAMRLPKTSSPATSLKHSRTSTGSYLKKIKGSLRFVSLFAESMNNKHPLMKILLTVNEFTKFYRSLEYTMHNSHFYCYWHWNPK